MKSKIIILLGTALLAACNASTQAASWTQPSSGIFLDWKSADGYCQKMTTGGEKWRLPSLNELVNRYKSTTLKAPWDANGSGIDWVWSSTAYDPQSHYLVNVNNGSKSWPDDSRQAFVVCVSGRSNESNAWYEEAENAMYLEQWGRAINAATPSANSGNSQAILVLAKLQFAGNGFPKDEKKGFSLYLKAANLGNATAQLSVATLYETGRGTAVDISQALEWYKKAAAQGDQNAIGAVNRLQPK